MIKITLVFRFIVILLIGLPMQANANENCLIDPMEIRELGLSIDHSTEIGDSEQFFKLLNSKLSKDLIACGVLMKFDDESLEKAIDGNNLQIFAHILKTIREQDLETLSKGKSVHSRDYWERALSRAIAKKNYVVARHLFKNTENRSYNFFSGEHQSYVEAQVMMSAAIKNDDPEMVKILMDGGVDFENKSKTPWIEQIGYKLVYGTREFDVSNGFLEALENDSVKVVSYILKRASGIRFLERSKYVLSLQYSLRNGGMPSKRMIAAFFDEGVSYKDMYGLDDKASLLSMAIGKNDDDMLSYLMETQNVPISEDGHDIRTAGLNAVLLERVLKYQLKQDPKWTFSDDSFWNKLNTISDENDDKLSGQMRTRTAIIRDIVGRTGSFALEREQSHIAAIKVFMALAINKNDKLALNTLLAASIGDENFYVAKYFIEQGADTNVKMRGESGETFGTLDITLSNCELPMAKLLLDNGADLLAQIRAIGSERPASDYSKNMTYSKEVYQKEVQADLLSRLNYCDSNPQLQEEMIRRIAQTKVIDLNYRDEGGEGLTLLERAILSKQPYVARALLQNGADPRTLDKGKYNLSYAIEHGDKEMVKVLRAGGAVVSPIDESRIALMNAVENSNFAAIKTIVNQQTPGSDCAIALKAVLVKNSDSIPLWLKNNCSFSEADQKDIFVLVLKKRNIPLLDIFKDWGIAALQRGEGNHFFSHSTSSWDVNVWLLNNQFVVESSRLDDLTADRFWENKDDNTAGLHRLFKDKVFNVDNPIICKAIPSLFPLEHSGVIKPAMKASDINYVRKFMSCYSKEEIQKVIVNIDLHRHLDNFDTANVRMVLALIADWTPYILTHHPSNRTPDFYSRYPDKLPIKVEIEEMLKKSNIQIAQ